MRQYYKSTSSYPDAKIKKFIDRLDENDELESEAHDALKELNELQEAQRQRLLQEDQARINEEKTRYEQQVELINSNIEKYKAEDARKNKIKSMFFNPIKGDDGNELTVFSHKINNIVKNPEHLVQLADLLLEYDSSKGFDFDRLQALHQTKKVKTLKELITEGEKTPKKASGTTLSSSDKNWDKYFEFL
jgi:hypothetical protein